MIYSTQGHASMTQPDMQNGVPLTNLPGVSQSNKADMLALMVTLSLTYTEHKKVGFFVVEGRKVGTGSQGELWKRGMGEVDQWALSYSQLGMRSCMLLYSKVMADNKYALHISKS